MAPVGAMPGTGTEGIRTRGLPRPARVAAEPDAPARPILKIEFERDFARACDSEDNYRPRAHVRLELCVLDRMRVLGPVFERARDRSYSTHVPSATTLR